MRIPHGKTTFFEGCDWTSSGFVQSDAVKCTSKSMENDAR